MIFIVSRVCVKKKEKEKRKKKHERYKSCGRRIAKKPAAMKFILFYPKKRKEREKHSTFPTNAPPQRTPPSTHMRPKKEKKSINSSTQSLQNCQNLTQKKYRSVKPKKDSPIFPLELTKVTQRLARTRPRRNLS